MQYWMVVTSESNFKSDRETIGFKLQGLPYRFRKQVQSMEAGDRVVYYIMKLQKFGATATITGDYYEDHTKIWIEDEEMWPSRRPSKADIILNDDELVDAKMLIPDLSFVAKKEVWGVFFQGSIRTIPENDFLLIESEMRKVIAERINKSRPEKEVSTKLSESQYQELIIKLPLQSNSLHDRLGEMLQEIGSQMDFRSHTRYKIIPDHAYELDVAWLSGKNPEVAIEIQISGNITEAKDRLAHARKFNYRKVILVILEKELRRLNDILKHEPELRNWLEAWSIGAVYEMYTNGQNFFKYYRTMIEATYKDKKELEFVK
jgi:hypothetical protein